MSEPYYSDDRVTLYLGDCLEHPEWWAGADVLVTDPPYGIAWRQGYYAASGARAHPGIAGDATTAVRDAALEVWAPRPAVVFGAFAAAPPADTRQWLVFRKAPNAGLRGSVTGYRRDVEPIFLVGAWPRRAARWSSLLATRSPSAGNPYSPAGLTGHPHAKPLDVMEALIDRCPDGVIADPFAGSGSTLVAARNLGRRVVGVEVDEAYCEVAARRLAQDCLDLAELAHPEGGTP